jgi:NDP-sugar pyrophosphorylase family protein
MQALILAGGKGTRLRPLTVYTPKPIVPFLNKPFLLYQIEILRRAGIEDITLSLSYQPDKIEHLLASGAEFGVNLRYITEPSPMGTGGAYRFAVHENEDTTVVLNGDVMTDVSISELVGFHESKKADATILLAPVENPSAYGLVETGPENEVLRFLEKPKPDDLANLTTNTINAGIYVLQPSVLSLIPVGKNYSFEYNVFPDLLARQMRFFGYILGDEYWRDIGTPDSYLQGHRDFLDGRIRGFDADPAEDAEVATAAVIGASSVIGKDCVIKPNAKILNSVLGTGVHVEEHAVIEDSVIWSHTRIAGSAEIRGAVIGRSCHIGRNVSVGPGAVLGDKTLLTDYTRV